MSRRNGRGRRGEVALAAALLAFGIVSLPSAAQAAGNGYYAVQCHDWDRDASEMGLSPHQSYSIADQCEGPNARLSITNASGAVINQGAQFTLTAPSGTAIREVQIDANLRRGSHHLAQIGVWNGSNVDVLANGPDSDPGWQHYAWGGLNHPQLVIRLYCSAGNCPADGQAHVYARNVTVQLVDNYDPAAPSLGGGLLAGSWVRGGQTLSAATSDIGSGVNVLNAEVNDQVVASAGSCDTEGVGYPYTGRLVPCVGSTSINQALDTGAGPFRNGANTIRVAAKDYAQNPTAVVQRTVMVDNAQPSLAFANTQDAEDPELIRAPVSDEHSGVASAKLYMRMVNAKDWQPLETRVEGGEARARVDSAGLPAGEYEFKASAADLAGNTVETTVRSNGEPMKLAFPLRAGVELLAHLGAGGGRGQTVRYGTDSKVEGRLLDAAGRPIIGKDVLIVENFGEGALIRHRPTTVTTDEEGRFSSKVPAGPTRRIEATFAGTQKYTGADRNVGELTVKSRATFKVPRKSVPEGSAATFKGKVGHFGARIPSGGKLVELQVRLKTGRWDTVGQAFRTNEKGRYKRQYRFGKHYNQDAVFRFRVKVAKEANWPYKRAASKQRKLIVRAR